MANLTIIALVGKNLELGKDNDLIWKIKEDMKFFREYTIHKKIVMGINTFYSLPKLLPNRKHIVITSRNLDLGEDVSVFHSIFDVVAYLNSLDEEVMIIGGAKVYKEMLPYTDSMILTLVDDSCEADVYFPSFDSNLWNQELLGEYETDDFTYKRIRYNKK